MKPRWQIKIAKERIQILFKLAEQEFKKNIELSRKWISLARRIALRYNIRLGELKRKFCKVCNCLLIPGYSSKVRILKGLVWVKCLRCGKIYRYR